MERDEDEEEEQDEEEVNKGEDDEEEEEDKGEERKEVSEESEGEKQEEQEEKKEEPMFRTPHAGMQMQGACSIVTEQIEKEAHHLLPHHGGGPRGGPAREKASASTRIASSSDIRRNRSETKFTRSKWKRAAEISIKKWASLVNS